MLKHQLFESTATDSEIFELVVGGGSGRKQTATSFGGVLEGEIHNLRIIIF